MKTLIDLDHAPVFAIPPLYPSGRQREGLLIEGPQGWGEFSPDADDDDRILAHRLTAAVEGGTVGWPDPIRGRIPIAVTVPAVDAAVAARLGTDLRLDVERVAAVRDALGPHGSIRCDARGRWDVQTAVAAISALDRAAGGLEFVEQPCAAIEDVATVRRRVGVRLAVGAWLYRALDPRLPADAADLAVLSSGPMGGVRRALRIAELTGLPCAVSTDAATSIGVAGGLALAGALPELPFACALGTRLLRAGDIVSGSRSLIPVDGHLPVAPMPAAPEPDLVERYRLTDGPEVAGLRNRLRAAERVGRR